MEIGLAWQKYWDDDLEEFRFPVYLTYWETKMLCLPKSSVTSCRRRDGREWKSVDRHTWVLHKQVRDWLEEHIGHEDIVWPVDRIYYFDEELPELPKGKTGYKWRQEGMEPYGEDEKRWQFKGRVSYNANPSRNQYAQILFKSSEHQQLFYDAWKMNDAELSLPYSFGHLAFEHSTFPSQAFMTWMRKNVGKEASSPVDFLRGDGAWCCMFDNRDDDHADKNSHMVLWFKDSRMAVLTKLVWV